MKYVIPIFWTFILSTTFLVQAKDNQQSDLSQKDTILLLSRRHPSADQKQTSNINLNRRVRTPVYLAKPLYVTTPRPPPGPEPNPDPGCCEGDTDCFPVPDPWIPDPDPWIPDPDPMMPCPDPCGPCNSARNSVANAAVKSMNTKIIGGVETTIEAHPYIVSIRKRKSHNCGGTILNQNTILTSAHCFKKSEENVCTNVTIKVGATKYKEGKIYKVTDCIVHPEYSTDVRKNNDLAILKLAKPLTFTPTVQPIPLQPADTPVPPGTTAILTGWGRTIEAIRASTDVLRETVMQVISNEDCRLSYDKLFQITTEMLCVVTPGRGSCQGDSGGPLVADGKLIGVVSFARGCANPIYPDVYANISALRGFICEHL